MSELDGSFAKLLGRQPSDAERQKLYQVRDALGLKNNDALWLVLMALEHYQGQYEKFPEKISSAVEYTLAHFKVTADATVKASAEAAKADMAKAVAETAEKVALNVSAKSKWKWACGCFAVVAIALVSILGFDMYRYEKLLAAAKEEARNSGYAVGYEKAMNEKARDAWANTPAGQKAYKLDQEGLLDAAVALDNTLTTFLQCSGNDWKIVKQKNGKKACFPQGDNPSGWYLP